MKNARNISLKMMMVGMIALLSVACEEYDDLYDEADFGGRVAGAINPNYDSGWWTPLNTESYIDYIDHLSLSLMNPKMVNFGAAASRTSSYHYAPSLVTVDNSGYQYLYTCSNGEGDEWDWIRLSISTNNGETFTPTKVVLKPLPRYLPRTVNGKKIVKTEKYQYSACDPNIIRTGGYYYLYYTAAIPGYNNSVYIARSRTPTGDFKVLMNDGQWRDHDENLSYSQTYRKILYPKAIVRAEGASYTRGVLGKPNGWYGAGQPSVVYKNGFYYMWHLDNWNGNAQRVVRRVSRSPWSGWENSSRKEISMSTYVNRAKKEDAVPLNNGDFAYNSHMGLFEVYYMMEQLDGSNQIWHAFSRDGVSWRESRAVREHSNAGQIATIWGHEYVGILKNTAGHPAYFRLGNQDFSTLLTTYRYDYFANDGNDIRDGYVSNIYSDWRQVDVAQQRSWVDQHVKPHL